jgi:hypothetical protein
MLQHVARLVLSSARPGFPATVTRFLATPSPASQIQVLVEPLGNENEGISVVSLNRPGSRNALGHQLIRELQDAINILRQERTTRCVLLRSVVPGVFCAGAGQLRLRPPGRLALLYGCMGRLGPKRRLTCSCSTALHINALDALSSGGRRT